MKAKRVTLIAGILTAGLSALAIAAAPLAQPVPSARSGAKASHIGEKVHTFTLRDTDGKTHDLQQYLDDGKIVVLEWFNPDCPFVKAHHASSKNMNRVEAFAREHDIVWLAINSGAPGKQGAGLERNRKARADYEIEYPILLDEDGKVGRMFGAKTTPDMRIISKDGILVYSGAIDNGATPQGRTTPLDKRTNYVLDALQDLVAGETISVAQTKPYGCSVKYGRQTRRGG